MTRCVIWPEGEPRKAVFSTSYSHALWLQFWLGLKSCFPDPRKARRICGGPTITDAMSAADTAEMWEDRIAKLNSKAKK